MPDWIISSTTLWTSKSSSLPEGYVNSGTLGSFVLDVEAFSLVGEYKFPHEAEGGDGYLSFGTHGNFVLDVEAFSLVGEDRSSLVGVEGGDGVAELCFSANLFFAVLCQFLRPSMTRSAKIDSFMDEPI